MDKNNNIDPKLLEEDDRIDAYLKGQMSADEEQLFLKELNENPELKQKAIMTARLVKGLKQVGAVHDKDIKGAFLSSSKEGIETAIKHAFQMKEEIVSNDELLERANQMEKAAIHLATVMGINIPEGANQMEAATKIIEMFATNVEQINEQEKPVAAIMLDIPEDEELRKSAIDSVSTPDINISTPEQKKKTPIRRVSYWLAIAASLVFFVWIGFEYNDYRRTTGLGEEYGNAFTSSMIVRGDEPLTDAEKKLESLFANVKNSEYLDNTIHELSLCWELSTMETYNDYTNYSAEIGWSLAIAYLKDNNKKDAKVVLEKLVAQTESGNAINTKAIELLGELK